ncbi:MAG: cation:proton antiporter [Gammaproteobacteria bacterium]|nr:cation:proton antiporter [Gammaproteobacteria bacterium]
MRFLYLILVLLVITHLFAVLARRLRMPAIVGELLAGVALGLALSRYREQLPLLWDLTCGDAFSALVNLGMFFLMLLAGIRMEPLDFSRTSGSAPFVALGGMVVPIVSGTALGLVMFPDSPFKLLQSLFLGTALAITAVPVTIRMLMEFNKLDTPVGMTIVAAALWDDLLSLFLMAFLVAAISNGATVSADFSSVLLLSGKVALYFLVTIPVGFYVFPWIGRYFKYLRIPEVDFSMLLIGALAYAVFAEFMGLHFIIGAFLAGLFFFPEETGQRIYDRVEQQTSGITSGFLAPIFFVSVGFNLDLIALSTIPVFVALLIVIALLSKFLGSGLPAYLTGLDARDSAAVGVAMSGRGAVELIIAGVALQAGLFAHPEPTPPIIEGLYSAIVIMAIVTTVVTPLLLGWLIRFDK